MEEWENHYCKLLKGNREDITRMAERRILEGDLEEGLNEEEIEKQIKRG